MYRFRLFNEKGLTLVELLAAIALIGIIGVISFRLLTGMFSANITAENDISLKQEANIILTSIRQKAQAEDVEICIPEKDSLLINDEDVLNKDGIIITDFRAENRENGEIISEGILFSENIASCIISDVEETLVVNMNITAKEGPSNYEISSVIPGLSDPNRSYTIEPPTEEDTGSGEPPSGIFTTQEEFEALTQDTIDESIGDLDNDNKIFSEDLYVFPSSTWRNDNIVEVRRNTLFGGDITMQSETTFSSLNTYFQGNIYVPNSGTIETNGSIRIDGDTILKSQAEIISEGYFFANDNVMLENNTNRIEAERNIYLNRGGSLDGASIESGGDIYLKGDFTLKNNATFFSEGSIHLEGSMDGKGFLCAKGDISTEGSVDKQINIKDKGENYNSCK